MARGGVRVPFFLYWRGGPVGLPLWQVFWDPDFFRGEEHRPPWMEIAQEVR
jgi:hypothetical protein